ncbi:MAG: glycoside hydrolase family protein [Proteobacteria bacterium]|nr:glycoside hydrolase family protein [Pseudomonadota bacterium]
MNADSTFAMAGGYDAINEVVSRTKIREGFSSTPYKDNRGVWTIGYGFALTGGITKEEASVLLEMRIRRIQHRMPMVVPYWHDLSPVRQGVLISMAYNLGIRGMLGFDDMHTAASHKDFVTAACAMLDSLWAVQVGDEPGQRAYELAVLMQNG